MGFHGVLVRLGCQSGKKNTATKVTKRQPWLFEMICLFDVKNYVPIDSVSRDDYSYHVGRCLTM